MVFVPLHDRNKLEMIPFQRVTVTLIVLNVLVFLVQIFSGQQAVYGYYASFGFTPIELFGTPAAETIGPAELPAVVTLFTYTFLHGDFWHLAGNMLFLWVFGDNVEDAMGHTRFLIFYLLGGAGAALAEATLGSSAGIPLIGASGAISACIGAYLMLHPRVWIWVLVLGRIPLPLPAYGVIALWVLTQIAFLAFDSEGGVAWWAHLGGFVVGAVLIIPFRRKDVPLLDRKLPSG